MSRDAPRLDPVRMLGRSHLAAVRALLLASALVLDACAPPPAPTAVDARPPLRSFCTIRLDANEGILIAHVFTRDTTSPPLAGVIELGGRVSAIVGDTLVLQPYYLTTRPATADGAPVTIFRGKGEPMPDRVLIPMTPSVSIREFRTPGTTRRRVTLTLVFGGLFLLTTLASDVALLLSL